MTAKRPDPRVVRAVELAQTEATIADLATTPAAPRQAYHFFCHYNKARPEWGPLDTMLVHMAGKIYPCPGGLTCHMPTRSQERPTQPRIVMTGWSSGIQFDSKGHAHLLP